MTHRGPFQPLLFCDSGSGWGQRCPSHASNPLLVLTRAFIEIAKLLSLGRGAGRGTRSPAARAALAQPHGASPAGHAPGREGLG